MIIYCGPSLTLGDKVNLKQKYPKIKWEPPVKRGDIELALSQNIKELLIIDGYFENQNPIWQREIFYALKEGMTIFGCASMGALRAIELAEYGMIGLGQIYKMYKRGEIDGDDEVALCHSIEPINGEYIETTIPLVNLRYAIHNMTDKKQIEYLRKALEQLKAYPFQNRDEINLQKILLESGMLKTEIKELISSMQGRGKNNLKNMDAKEGVTKVMEKKNNGLIHIRKKYRDQNENIEMKADAICYRKLKEGEKEIDLGMLVDSKSEKLKQLYEQVAEDLHIRFYVSLWCDQNKINPDPAYYFDMYLEETNLEKFQQERGGFTKSERENTLNKKIITKWVESNDFKNKHEKQIEIDKDMGNIDFILSNIAEDFLGKVTEETIQNLKIYPPSKYGFNYDERIELLSYWDIEKLNIRKRGGE